MFSRVILAILFLLVSNNNFLVLADDTYDEPELDDTQLLQAARAECAKVHMKWDNTFDLCIDDVMRMRDVGVVFLWDLADEDMLTAQAKWMQKARIACASVQEQGRHAAVAPASNKDGESQAPKSDFDLCVQQVVQTENVETAQQWTQTSVQRKLRGAVRN